MFDVILYRPEIPPNTGNIIRLCANAGTGLHLVGPMAFALSDARLRRAGLDYHEWARVRQYANLADCLAALGSPRLFAFSTRGTSPLAQAGFVAGDALLFGAETSGLPADVLASIPAPQVLRIPMRPNNRSLNLSNAVAIVVYEAWRQQQYAGAC